MKYFIIGLIFGLSIQPIISSFTSLILSFIEMLKSHIIVKTATNDKKIDELSTDTSTRVIGFAPREEVEEENDDI